MDLESEVFCIHILQILISFALAYNLYSIQFLLAQIYFLNTLFLQVCFNMYIVNSSDSKINNEKNDFHYRDSDIIKLLLGFIELCFIS